MSEELQIGDRVAYDGEGESTGPGTVVNKIFAADEDEYVYTVAWDGSEDPDQDHVIAELRKIDTATADRFTAYVQDELLNGRVPETFLDFEEWESEHGKWQGLRTS